MHHPKDVHLQVSIIRMVVMSSFLRINLKCEPSSIIGDLPVEVVGRDEDQCLDKYGNSTLRFESGCQPINDDSLYEHAKYEFLIDHVGEQ
jgi:hypothetical protein